MKLSYEFNDAVEPVRWVGGFAVAFWGGIPAMVQTLFVMMALDYFTGLMNAWGKQALSSDIGRRGLVKKAQIAVLVCALRYAEKRSGVAFHAADGMAIAFIVTELISIAENCARAGVRLPGFVVSGLLALQKKVDAQPATPEQLRALEASAGEGGEPQ